MFQVIGFKHQVLKFNDGNEVTGYKLHMIEKREGVVGYACESVFISDKKLGECGYVPLENDHVELFYNRWGKVERINQVKK